MPLILNLLRHGEAAPAGADGDAGRPLTPGGQAAVQALAERLAREGWRPDRMFSSPLLRARQTAAIVSHRMGLEEAVPILAELDPDEGPETVLAALEAHGATSGNVLLVGHQPQLGMIAGYLSGRDGSLRPAELLRIECPDGPGRRVGRVIEGPRAG